MNDTPIHHRRSIRLKGYDYSQAGWYFVTLCTHNRACLFGEIINGQMVLNDAGRIAMACWMDIPRHFKNVILHEYIVMPNHIHGIIQFTETAVVGAKNFSPPGNTPNDGFGDNGANDISPNDNAPNNISPGDNGANNVSAGDNAPNNISPNDNAVNNISSRDNGTNNVLAVDNMVNDISSGDNGAKNVLPLRGTSKTIGSVVRGVKIGVTKWMRQNTDTFNVWQRNYYEHIIRDEHSCQTIARYIINNPAKWNEDRLFR